MIRKADPEEPVKQEENQENDKSPKVDPILARRQEKIREYQELIENLSEMRKKKEMMENMIIATAERAAGVRAAIEELEWILNLKGDG